MSRALEDPGARSRFRRAVLRWAGRGLRPLPWRDTRDPWQVLVSEVMLQQTQAGRVVPYWRAFVARFPTPAECAAAPRAEVVRHWGGLGYNRRAVYLHQTATALVERHQGLVPADLGALTALPGIGPYTARAVLAFAFEQPAAVVDVNSARLLSRAVAGAPLTPGAAQELADHLLPGHRVWLWNQAVLDLGAEYCTRRGPRCGSCPVAAACVWCRAGHPEPDPVIGGVGAPPAQSRFAGSDRQGRGRLVAALRAGPVPTTPSELAAAAGWPQDPERARRVADSLVADGLARHDRQGRLHLA